MATIAVLVALGGTSIAAVSLTRNSVKGKHIAPNAVTSPKVKDKSLRAKDFAAGQLPAGAPGPNGDQGAPGSPGLNGAPGANGQDATAPSGAVMFFDLGACPSGWTELASARGRYIVGLPSGGILNATAGTALAPQENRPVGMHSHNTTAAGSHSHTVASGTEAASGPIALLRGPTTAATSDSTSTGGSHGHTTDNAGTVAGTNAPYLQLLACRKD